MTAPRFSRLRLATATFAVLLGWATPALAQVKPCAPPAKQPPANSPTLVRCLEIYAHPINETNIDLNTYLYYIKTPYSVASEDKWAPYDEEALKADFWALWKTTFLDNLWIEVLDEPFENGVKGKHLVFHIEERSKVRAVDYVAKEGTKTAVDISKIEDSLREKNVNLSLDTFVDQATIRKVKGVIREVYADKGFNDVRITTELKPMPAGPKFVHVSFTIDQGPKYKLQDIIFEGNAAYTDAQLRSQMKENKPKAWWSFFTSGGTYMEAKFEEDAFQVEEFYKNNGYVRAVVGQPKIETVKDSRDGATRYIRLRLPVEEGQRYKIGTFTISDNTAIKTEPLRSFFKLAEGDYYDHGKVKKGIEKIQELYGQLGFWQFTPEPIAKPRGFDPETGQPIGPEPPPPIVDVNIRMNEGKQYFVNRITLLGNTTTHDGVARRELRVLEGGVFDTAALKESIRRLNQLGYFKPLEGKDDEVSVEPTPGREGLVDIKLKFQEQNRNQISFGAGVSQYDGFFGQLSYQTSNFLGRGETFGVNLQRGSRAQQYQLSFSEPYLFDRPITAGIEGYSRTFVYPYQFSQGSTGGTIIFGYPLARNLRMFTSYGYERVRVYDINEIYLDAAALASNPYLRESLLIDTGGSRTVSKVTPQIVFNTVNAPLFPTAGRRLSAAVELAGLGGNTEFTKARLEGIFYFPLSGPQGRFNLGVRGEGQWIAPRGVVPLPIFEKFFLGGEYSVRGFDMRSIGPRDPFTGVVTGGNKTLTFNAELYVTIAGPVRLLAFYDAGQVKDVGENFTFWEPITETVRPDPPLLYHPFATVRLTNEPYVETINVIGKAPAFKTSTGLELRFFMPVLNVPFRLIASWNPSRRGVFNNNLELTKRFTFRFAVGTTF